MLSVVGGFAGPGWYGAGTDPLYGAGVGGGCAESEGGGDTGAGGTTGGTGGTASDAGVAGVYGLDGESGFSSAGFFGMSLWISDAVGGETSGCPPSVVAQEDSQTIRY